jgi:hypothetical protein
MRIAQSKGLLPYPSSVLGQDVVSQHPLVPLALRGFPQQAVLQSVQITSKLNDSQTTIPEFTLFSLPSMFWDSASSLLFNALDQYTL